MFDIVQDVLKGKKKQNFTMGGPDKDFIFRGLLRCGHCGGCITSEYHISKSGKRHNYLKCNNHGASKSNCPQCVVREEDILRQLNDQVFSQIHVNEDFMFDFYIVNMSTKLYILSKKEKLEEHDISFDLSRKFKCEALEYEKNNQ